jgi:hypothetical protein
MLDNLISDTVTDKFFLEQYHVGLNELRYNLVSMNHLNINMMQLLKNSNIAQYVKGLIASEWMSLVAFDFPDMGKNTLSMGFAFSSHWNVWSYQNSVVKVCC